MILDVVAVISNPIEFKTRYRLFNEFCTYMKSQMNVRLTTVELQYKSRKFVTDATLKLSTDCEIWHKENLINLAIKSLPDDWEYVAWIDSDIKFVNENWVQETLSRLQLYDVLQLFSHAIDLGPNCETLAVHTGFFYLHQNGEKMNNYRPHLPYKNGHTGYAYACTRKAYFDMGGLIECAILGSADAHMAMALIGDVDTTLNKNLHPNYKIMCQMYQSRCDKYIKQNVGYVPGTILHYFHGNKGDRQYASRWQILIKHCFDPFHDIVRGENGLWVLDGFKPQLRDDIRRYFRNRNEDAIVLNQDYPCTKKHWN